MNSTNSIENFSNQAEHKPRILKCIPSQGSLMPRSTHTKSNSQIVKTREKKTSVQPCNTSIEPKKPTKVNLTEKPKTNAKYLISKCKDLLTATKTQAQNSIPEINKKYSALNSTQTPGTDSKLVQDSSSFDQCSGIMKNKCEYTMDLNKSGEKEGILKKNTLYIQNSHTKSKSKVKRCKENNNKLRNSSHSPERFKSDKGTQSESDTNQNESTKFSQARLKNRRVSKNNLKTQKKNNKLKIKSANCKKNNEIILNFSEFPNKKVKFLNNVVVIDEDKQEEKSLKLDSLSENSFMTNEDEWTSIDQNKLISFNSEFVEEFKEKINKSNERLKVLLSKCDRSEESSFGVREESFSYDRGLLKNSERRGSSFDTGSKEKNKKGGLEKLLVYSIFGKQNVYTEPINSTSKSSKPSEKDSSLPPKSKTKNFK